MSDKNIVFLTAAILVPDEEQMNATPED